MLDLPCQQTLAVWTAIRSQDATPSDCYLFGCAKACLAARSFVHTEGCLCAVQSVLSGVPQVALDAVFLTLMERVR
jgi:hypothetical protein